MPNWCSNRLQIIGATADLLDFVNKGIETSLNGATSFEKVKVTKKLESLEELNENPDNFPNFSAWLPMPKILLDIASMQEDERRRFYIEGSGKKSDFKFSDELTALIEKAKEEIGTDNWYSWAIGHWGTKWDCNSNFVNFVDCNDGDDDAIIVLDYDTAWSPNSEWLLNVGENYPNLRFHLDSYEPGCQIEFGAFVEDGEYCECNCDIDWLEEMRWANDEEEWDDSSLDAWKLFAR